MFYVFYYDEEWNRISLDIWLQEYFFLYGEASMGGMCMHNWSKVMERHLHEENRLHHSEKFRFVGINI